jgi:hypothetical protein
MKENLKPQNVLGFIASVLPSLIAGKTSFRAIFSSYNSIGDYPTGPLLCGKQGLDILVSNGGRDNPAFLPRVLASAMSGSLEAMEMSNKIDEIGAERAQTLINQSVPEEVLANEDLAVIYAGLNAPGKALEFAEMIRTRSPQAFIVIVTCDCGLDRDKYPLFRAKSELIDMLIVSHICGGSGTTGSILDALIELWPDNAHKN